MQYNMGLNRHIPNKCFQQTCPAFCSGQDPLKPVLSDAKSEFISKYKENKMIRNDGNKLTFRELLLPLGFALIGLAIIIPSIPGQGNSGFIAFGVSLSFIGVAIARMRLNKKASGKE